MNVLPTYTVSPLMFLNHQGFFESEQFENVENTELDAIKMNIPPALELNNFWRNLRNNKFLPCSEERTKEFYANFPDMQELAISESGKEFKRKTRHILSLVAEAFRGLDVPFWMSSGTCLGWFRQCDVVPYSGDVDIGVLIRDHTPDIIPVLENQGLQLRMKFGLVEDSLQYSFVYKETKLDIYFFYEQKDIIWNGATKPETGEKYKYIFPSFDLCWTEFLEIFLRVPCPTEPYLEANYGKNWFQPVAEWDWRKSPPNSVFVGKWDDSIFNETVQIFEVH